MAKTETKEFLCEFFDLYKEFPALWRVKSSIYKDRTLKASSYEKLVEKFKEIYPDANRDMVVKKINAFRTNYRKELKKVKDSQKSGAGADDIYEPTLWYYNKLNFLQDQEDCLEGRTTMDEQSEEKMISRPKRKKHSEEDNLIKMACEQLKSNKSSNCDTEILAKSWASQYKEMEGNQKLISRKIISDILFHGCMGTLSMSNAVEIQQILLHESSNLDPQSSMESQMEYPVHYVAVGSDLTNSSTQESYHSTSTPHLVEYNDLKGLFNTFEE